NSVDVREQGSMYEANIEALPNGTVCAEIVEFPGCYAMAKDAPTAIEEIATRIPAYYDWLRAHDDYTPIVPGPYLPVKKETQPGGGEAFGTAFFATDAEPVSPEDLDWLTAPMEWSLDDVVRLGERIKPSAQAIPTRYGASPNEMLQAAALTQAKILD